MVDQVESGGLVMLIGAPDTGKTTLTTLLLHQALQSGAETIVIDADVGQSEIGPPTTVSLGLLTKPFEGIASIKPAASAFVGATSPAFRTVEYLIALHQMVRHARRQGPHLIVVDTGGLVLGAVGRRLKRAEIDLLQPDQLAVLQRAGECEPIMVGRRYASTPVTHRLPVPAGIKPKSNELRASRRAMRFAQYFGEAEMRAVDLNRVEMIGNWLGCGQPAPPAILSQISRTLQISVEYGEIMGEQLGLLLRTGEIANAERKGILFNRNGEIFAQPPVKNELMQQCGLEIFKITPVGRLQHALVGLFDREDKFLGLGLIESLDFRAGKAGIFTPIKGIGAVCSMQIGAQRIKPDGVEIGYLVRNEL